MSVSPSEQEPKPPLVTEPEGYFCLPTRVFWREGIGIVLNHIVLLYDITHQPQPPKTELLPGTIRITQPATVNGQQVGWWSGVYTPPIEGDSDYLDLPRDHTFTD